MRRPLRIAPGKAAARFIDLQEEHRQDKRYLVAGVEAVIPHTRDLQRQARAAEIPVLHAAYVVDPADRKLRPFHPVMPDGSSAFSDKDNPLSAVCPEVGTIGDEALLVKSEASAFGNGELSHGL